MQPSDALSEAQRLIPDVLQALERDQATYRLISAKESLRWTAWMETHFPMTEWAGIAWRKVPGSICVEWATWEEAGEQLRSLCDRIGLGNPTVIVTWTNARLPAVQIPLSVMRRHAVNGQ